ncbi:MAG: hypothetical protein ABSE89_08085 [Sedimentisphaerales bacterium]
MLNKAEKEVKGQIVKKLEKVKVAKEKVGRVITKKSDDYANLVKQQAEWVNILRKLD